MSEPTPATEAPPEAPYWAVIVNEGAGTITTEEFASRPDLVGRLRRLLGRQGYRAHVFQGRRLGISRGPHRFLMDGKDQIPLFEIRPAEEEDETGSLDDSGQGDQDPVYRAITRKGIDEDKAAAQAEAQAAAQAAPQAAPAFDAQPPDDDD